MDNSAPHNSPKKNCPFCAEEILTAAIKCKHCGEFLDDSKSPRSTEKNSPWYLRKTFIVIALGFVGPLALPLIWLRPQTSLVWKIGLSIGICVLTWVLYQSTLQSIRMLEDYYELLNNL